MRPRSTEHGFTLFEVVVSLMLLAVSVTAVMALMPAGLKAQQLARYRIYAAAKAMDVVHEFSADHSVFNNIKREGAGPGEVHLNALRPDLEVSRGAVRGAFFPLPEAIAARLDSENDEIRRILAAGGQIFYANARATTAEFSTNLSEGEKMVASESQKLLFAVVGRAQDNAVMHPLISWPYYEAYPSPPQERIDGLYDERVAEAFDGATYQLDTGTVTIGYDGLARPGGNETMARAYLLAGVHYLDELADVGDPFERGEAIDQAGPAYRPLPEEARAYRFLAHAAVWLGRFHDFAAGERVTVAGGREGWTWSREIDLEDVRDLHRWCLRLGTNYAAHFPYRWDVPRPLNRATFIDVPLLQSDYQRSHPWTAPGRATWPIVAARDMRRADPGPDPELWYGRSYHYDNREAIAAGWGEARRFTLCRRFRASSRCRQLVFWIADWQSYEDFETQPPAATDSAKWPFDQDGDYVNSVNVGYWGVREKEFLWATPERTHITTEFPKSIARANSGTTSEGRPFRNPGAMYGIWGADRNRNGRLDRGSIPPSQRLQAVSVARYNFYDPRVPLAVRE